MKYRVAIYRGGVHSGYVYGNAGDDTEPSEVFEASNRVAAEATCRYMQHRADTSKAYRESKGWNPDPVLRYEVVEFKEASDEQPQR